MFCCTLLYVHFRFAIILMGKRESWLLCLDCLPGVSWLLWDSSSRCHGFVCSLWLWYFLINLTYYFYTITASQTDHQSESNIAIASPWPKAALYQKLPLTVCRQHHLFVYFFLARSCRRSLSAKHRNTSLVTHVGSDTDTIPQYSCRTDWKISVQCLDISNKGVSEKLQ